MNALHSADSINSILVSNSKIEIVTDKANIAVRISLVITELSLTNIKRKRFKIITSKAQTIR